jgi:hypothetical protein
MWRKMVVLEILYFVSAARQIFLERSKQERCDWWVMLQALEGR